LTSPLFVQTLLLPALEKEEMVGKKGAPEGKPHETSPPKGKWSKSKCDESTLLRLVKEGLLQLKEVVEWRAPKYIISHFSMPWCGHVAI